MNDAQSQAESRPCSARSAVPPIPRCVDAIETLVRDGEDRALCRINVVDFAAKRGLDEEKAIRRLPACLAARPV